MVLHSLSVTPGLSHFVIRLTTHLLEIFLLPLCLFRDVQNTANQSADTKHTHTHCLVFFHL